MHPSFSNFITPYFYSPFWNYLEDPQESQNAGDQYTRIIQVASPQFPRQIDINQRFGEEITRLKRDGLEIIFPIRLRKSSPREGLFHVNALAVKLEGIN